MNGCTVLLVWTVRSSSSLCWAWLLVVVSGDLYFLITMWPRLRPGSYVMGPTHDLQHQQQQQQTRQDAEIHHTIQPPAARHATTTHHITAQHNISFFFRTPGPRLVRCSVLAACRSSQQRSAFRPPPSPAHITSQRWPNILQIFYTAEYLHISVITARTRGRGCLGSGYGGVR